MEDDKSKKNPLRSDKEKELAKKEDSQKASENVEKEHIKEQNKKEENMEVHHVRHEENHRYSIKIFLYEFLIIFLAVTISFFVENIRERYLDHHKEVQYVQSLLNDIKIDTVQLSQIIKSNTEQVKGIGTFIKKLENADSSIKFTNYIYYYSLLHLNSLENFVSTDRTITQLKNAGGLRLIQCKAVSDSIVNYDALIKDIVITGDICLKFFYDLSTQQRELLDLKVVRNRKLNTLLADKTLKLLKNDKNVVNIYYNNALFFGSLVQAYKNKLIVLNKHANNLIETLKSEYDIE